jgi:hypothetical protein
VQDEMQVRPDLTLNAGVRLEGSTMPRRSGGATSTCATCWGSRRRPAVRQPRADGVAALGAAWNVRGSGRTSVRGGYGLYFNTNTHQNLIVTVTNPPATPRVVIPRPRSRCRRSSAVGHLHPADSVRHRTGRACTCGT